MKKKPARIRKKKVAEEKLLKDLEKLATHWKNLLREKRTDKKDLLLNQIAENIIDLENDAMNIEEFPELEQKGQIVHFLITTPFGAWHVSGKTLLQAASTLDADHPQDSELYDLLMGKKEDSEKEKGPLIFWSLYQVLKGESH